MSGAGTRAPAGRATQTLRLPRAAVVFDYTLLNRAFEMLELADTSDVKVGQEPTFPGVVLLSSPSRKGFLLTVDDGGALHVTALPATRPF